MAVNELIVEASFTSNILNEEERLPGVPTDEQVETATGNWLSKNIDAAIAGEADEWLEENIIQETGYALDRSLTLQNAAAPADLVGAIGDAITLVQNDFPGGISVLPYIGLSQAEKSVTEAYRTITVKGNLVKQVYGSASSSYKAVAVIKKGDLKVASNYTNLTALLTDDDFLTLPYTDGRLRAIVGIRAKTNNGASENLPTLRLIYKQDGGYAYHEFTYPSAKASEFNGVFTVNLSMITDGKFVFMVTSKHSRQEFELYFNIVLDDPSFSGAIASDGDAW